MKSKWLSILLVLTILGAVVAGCVQDEPTDPTTSQEEKVPAENVSEVTSKDPTIWVEATYGDPETLFPGLDYETGGGEIIENIYDRLIWYKEDSVDELVPFLAEEVPSLENGGISEDGLNYTFKIREGVKFHDGSEMTVEDVAFTFQNYLLSSGSSSPIWMYDDAFFAPGSGGVVELVAAFDAGIDLSDRESILAAMDSGEIEPAYDDREALQANFSEEAIVGTCEYVKSLIVADAEVNTVTMKLAQSWAPFLPTLAGFWGSVQSKEWVEANGGWDGDCATWPKTYSPVAEDINQLPLGNSAMGTGPYKFVSWTPTEEIVLEANEDYWLQEPLWEGMPSGAPSLKTVIIKQVDEFSTRLAMAQAGDADNILLGSTEDWPIVDALIAGEFTYEEYMAGEPLVITDDEKPFIKITDVLAVNIRTDVGFQFVINDEGGNSYMGSGQLDGDGINSEFFSDAAVRRAFNYCFDYDTYLNDVLQGEAKRAPTVMLPGQAGYDESTPQYTYDIEKCREELKNSQWTSEDGTQLFDLGFRFALLYNVGNTQRQTVAELLQAGLQEAGEQFVVETVGLPWPTFLSAMRAQKLPLWIIGWIGDYYDSHNWVSAFTVGYYANKQAFPDEIKQTFRDIAVEAVAISDPETRDEFYKEIYNPKYHELAPAILLFHVKSRHYAQRYENGWYANPVYSGDWFYSLSKN